MAMATRTALVIAIARAKPYDSPHRVIHVNSVHQLTSSLSLSLFLSRVVWKKYTLLYRGVLRGGVGGALSLRELQGWLSVRLYALPGSRLKQIK